MSWHTSNILSIILSHVSFNNLIPFFLTHNLNFNTKFNFNTYRRLISSREFAMIIKLFPEMKIIGLCINPSFTFDSDLYSRLFHLKYVIIMGKDCDEYMDKCDENVNWLRGLNKVISIEFNNIKLRIDWMPLLGDRVKTLKMIRSRVCDFEGIQLYTQLQHVHILGICFLDGVTGIDNIGECPNLRVLKTCLSLDRVRMVSPYLKVFKYYNIDDFDCMTMRRLDLDACRRLRVIYFYNLNFKSCGVGFLSGCKNLRRLEFNECGGLNNLEPLIKCVRLKELIVGNKYTEIDVDVNLEKICSHINLRRLVVRDK